MDKKISFRRTRFFGGDKRIRTAGLLVANEALYQLSHIPLSKLIIYLFYFFVNKFQIST